LNSGCLSCGRGFHDLCQECECCSPQSKADGNKPESSEGTGAIPVSSSVGANGSSEQPEKNKRARSPKPNDELKDPHSTGRKRAALLFPLEPDKDCEWKRKAYCGGGKFPIIGCYTGKQEHRHHGPDKNTLNNSEGNVHRICDDCHNIWHSQNDPSYDSYWAATKHEPRDATIDELIARMAEGKYVASKCAPQEAPEGEESSKV
jgi:hypothetical protein